MKSNYTQIMNLLKDLTPDQGKRLIECVKRDQGLAIALNKPKSKMLSTIDCIESIINENAVEFCNELENNHEFARIFTSMIFRIQSPEDSLLDFLDFRDEAWPEE